MKRILLFLVAILSSEGTNAQSNFDYQRDWSTYLGSVGAMPIASAFTNEHPIHFDREHNIYLSATIGATSAQTESYYNQFIVGPNQNGIYIYPQGITSNGVNAKFSQSGSLSLYEYGTKWTEPNRHSKYLVNIDNTGNKYYVFYANGSGVNTAIPPATNGVWLTGSSNNTGITLVKYSSTGALLWATYTPTIFGVQVDTEGNVYISGSNFNQPDFTTPGVFQETFPANVSGYTGYIAKLNAQGQRLWVTYHAGFARKMRTHANGVYFTYDTIPFNNQIPISSAGAFQTSTANVAIMKLNASNGTRDWGTYYGPANNSYDINGLEVNETGLYIVGREVWSSANYFGTAGSFKPQVTGGSDYFLSKFNLNGNRVWSTYFGSDRDEPILYGSPIALSGDDIYVCGTITGDGNNIATPGAYQTAPEQNTIVSRNIFFSKFHSDGSMLWTSYYGGTSSSTALFVSIAHRNSTLYLYGNTNSSTGFATPGAWQTQIVNPLSNQNNTTNFLARFNQNILATSESNNLENNLVLYDNPNDGEFTISGKILEKKNCSFIIYDLSGRKIKTYKMSRANAQRFNLKNQIVKGNYIVVVQDSENNKLKSFKMIVK